jgi:hypothetical protein
MFKSRFLLGLGIISLVLVSLAISSFRTNASLSNRDAASDFALRHSNWSWSAAASPVAYSDYAQRHPELSNLAAQGASDYYERHPNQTNLVVRGPDTSDYALRHPEFSVSAAAASIDLTDYYFRHLGQ